MNPSGPSGQPTSMPTGQPSIMPTSAPSGQPTGNPSAYPTRHIRTQVQLAVQQEVKGITVAEFDETAKTEYINAIVNSLQEEMPELRSSMITITSVTQVVARRHLRGKSVGDRDTDSSDGFLSWMMRGVEQLLGGALLRRLGANSVTEVAYEIIYVAEELGCGSCSTGEQADAYFRTLLDDSTNQAQVVTFLTTYANTAALQAGIAVQATVFPNAYTMLTYQTQNPTSEPSSRPSSVPTILPNLGPDRYSSFLDAYGLFLLFAFLACSCLSLLAVFSYLYPSICTPWCCPCCLSFDQKQRLRYSMERTQYAMERFIEKERRIVRRIGNPFISGKYKVAPLGAASPSKKHRGGDGGDYAPRVRVVTKANPNKLLRAQRIRMNEQRQKELEMGTGMGVELFAADRDELDTSAPMKAVAKKQPGGSAPDLDADDSSLTASLQTGASDDASMESLSPDKEPMM